MMSMPAQRRRRALHLARNTRGQRRIVGAGRYLPGVDVNWWVVALPSLISGLAAFLAVVAGQRFTSRKEKREGQINEFHWIIGLITSESTEARRIGEVLLKDAVDHPERRDSAAQAQIIAIWSARILPDVAAYHEGDTFEIVDDEPEA